MPSVLIQQVEDITDDSLFFLKQGSILSPEANRGTVTEAWICIRYALLLFHSCGTPIHIRYALRLFPSCETWIHVRYALQLVLSCGTWIHIRYALQLFPPL